ncbi:MAG: hypothetical protein QOK05_2375 [Chloroflexota bacterium]|jgi:hypothetical protein|nr:hypothetical protein [Chloroflexota bacterium]
MDLKLFDYLIYVTLSTLLTIWVATTLFRHGRRFLLDVFQGDESLADSVNHLLVVGFYLVNLGYISLQLKLEQIPAGFAEVTEALALKVGLVLVVLGAMHFFNLFVLAKMRRNAINDRNPALPPAPVLPPPLPAPPMMSA